MARSLMLTTTAEAKRLIPAVDRALRERIPSIPPAKNENIKTKVNWTFMFVLLFLSMQNVPLFGVRSKPAVDPYVGVRGLYAGSYGTLTELGVLPQLSATVLLYIAHHLNVLTLNFANPASKHKFLSYQKFFSLLFALFYAILLPLSGIYGSYSELSLFSIVLLQLQLFASSGFVTYTIEALAMAGYGFNITYMIFLAVHTASELLQNIVSTESVHPILNNPDGLSFYRGACIQFMMLVFNFRNGSPFRNILHAVFGIHSQSNSIINLAATIGLILAITFGLSIKFILQFQHRNLPQKKIPIPVDFIDVKSIPVSLIGGAAASIYIASTAITNCFIHLAFLLTRAKLPAEETLASFITKWNIFELLARMITPSVSVLSHIYIPVLRLLIYVIFITFSLRFFAKIELEISDKSAIGITNTIGERGFMIQGRRSSADVVKAVVDKHNQFAVYFLIGLITACELVHPLFSAIPLIASILFFRDCFAMAAEEYAKENPLSQEELQKMF